MLYLVVYNAFYSFAKWWFIKGIFDTKEKAESMARIVCNELFEEGKKRCLISETEEAKDDIRKYYIKIIPLTLNQIYKSSTITIDGINDEAYIGDDNE